VTTNSVLNKVCAPAATTATAGDEAHAQAIAAQLAPLILDAAVAQLKQHVDAQVARVASAVEALRAVPVQPSMWAQPGVGQQFHPFTGQQVQHYHDHPALPVLHVPPQQVSSTGGEAIVLCIANGGSLVACTLLKLRTELPHTCRSRRTGLLHTCQSRRTCKAVPHGPTFTGPPALPILRISKGPRVPETKNRSRKTIVRAAPYAVLVA
jgi:hypothetical protein